MNRIILLILASALIFACTTKTEHKKPNILFIFADDQTFNSINAGGNNDIITPHLDKLAQSGVSFTHTYNMGAWHGAVCVASRAMLNTGRFLWHAREQEKNYKNFAGKRMFWSQMMEDAGYETYMTGKWHVKFPADSIFQNAVHIRPGMPATVPEAYNRPLSPEDTIWLPWHKKYGGFWEGGTHWSEVLANDAIHFLEQARNSEKPFFMYLAFNASHDPRQSPKKFVEMYPLEKIPVPESFMELYPYKEQIGCGKDLRDEKLAPFPRTLYSMQVHRQEYYALITHMDHQIGRIINYIKENGLADNTYILYSADHGLSVGHHGLMGKQNMYDHSMRVPCILAGPDIPANETRKMQVYIQDLMATSLDLAGIDKPDYVEFNSLMPLIINHDATAPYNEIYGAYRDLQRMVRTEKYKLIVYPEAGKIRLFDIEKDPEEINDLTEEQKYDNVISELAGKLKRQQKIMDDTLNLHSFFPEIF
jgi:arylsulfatase A-like enzyme